MNKTSTPAFLKVIQISDIVIILIISDFFFSNVSLN